MDDCSPDNSIDVMLKMLEEYPARKPQVKLIRHEINQGVSQSRQDGVEAATGEYIIHCDPDDWVELDMYEQLYTKAKETNADVITSDYTYENGNESITINQYPNELTGISILQSITGVNRINIHGALWNKLIKANKYKGLRFPQGINYCEDVFLLFQLFSINNIKLEYLNKSLYHYFNHPQSLVNTINEKSLEMDRALINKVLQYGNKNPIIAECSKSFAIATIWGRAFLFGNISDTQFKYYYCNHIPLVKYNKQIKFIDKILLKLAGWGHLHTAKRIRKTLAIGKKIIKQK